MSAFDPKQTSRLREPLVAWVFPAVATYPYSGQSLTFAKGDRIGGAAHVDHRIDRFDS